jgi:energy-coupling factor transporter transmembrane protein EcfT
MSLTMLGLTALLIVLVSDRLDIENARGDPRFEWYGLGLLAVFALSVVVVAAVYGRHTWSGYALAPLTLAVVIVSFLIGTARVD